MDYDIVISGGGIAGLAAAAAFGASGFATLCVDPAPPVTEREADGADLRTTAFLQPAQRLSRRDRALAPAGRPRHAASGDADHRCRRKGTRAAGDQTSMPPTSPACPSVGTCPTGCCGGKRHGPPGGAHECRFPPGHRGERAVHPRGEARVTLVGRQQGSLPAGGGRGRTRIRPCGRPPGWTCRQRVSGKRPWPLPSPTRPA